MLGSVHRRSRGRNRLRGDDFGDRAIKGIFPRHAPLLLNSGELPPPCCSLPRSRLRTCFGTGSTSTSLAFHDGVEDVCYGEDKDIPARLRNVGGCGFRHGR
ncbi:unnamed protein product [Fraxinus pennsylvanica]|uniref:Uncharacterized protein n=1 Tax=Fraxinus pennsylvanica TaxID=56036 RepID=A0AAD2AK80_9LAMI|nr:unnamed protein product [Fraxinus pennsylvanica]